MRALVVVPTYNEAEGIETLLSRVLTADPDLQVLVVDDSSPDGTGKIVTRIAESTDRLKLLTRPKKEGLGKAYVAGFMHGLAAGFEQFIEMDADLSHDPADLPRLLEAAGGADLVIGSRYVDGGDVAGWTRGRELLSRSANYYARMTLRLQIHDVTAGFRCYRREVLELIDLNSIESGGYAFQVEMTYRTDRAGFRIVEVPIVFKERVAGQSKMSRQIALEGLLWVGNRGLTDLRERFRKS